MIKLSIKIIVFIFILFIFSYTIFFSWIVLDKHNSIYLKKADAIIVLGAAAWGEKPSPAFKNRIIHAIELYQKGFAKNIIFTGGTPNKNYTSEGEVATKWAIKNKIPAQSIFTDKTSRNTYQNLLNAKIIAQQHGFKTFIVVSDNYHLTRAKLICILLNLKAQTSATPHSHFSKTNLETKLKTYVKETNSIYGAFIYYLLTKMKFLT